MAGVVIDVTARMVVDALKKHFESFAVEEIFGGVNLKAKIDAGGVVGVENRPPTARLLVEAFFDETCGALRVGIKKRPRQRAREGDVFGKPKPPGDRGGFFLFLGCPKASFFGVAAHLFGRLAVEH
jgi:hypothetical protein